MEAALLSGFIRIVLPKLHSLADSKYKLYKGLERDINFLEQELPMIMGAIEDDDLSSQSGEDQGVVRRLSIEKWRKLAHDIEDCVDRLLYRVVLKRQSSIFRRISRSPKTLGTHLHLAQQLRELRKLVEEERPRYTTVYPAHPSSATRANQSLLSISDPRNIVDADLVGLDGPLAELLEQLDEAKGGLKVISIVGFCGLGKTALAAQLYNRVACGGGFEKEAWVCAAHRAPLELLKDILRKLSTDDRSSLHGACEMDEICADIMERLASKRYFIVIDDIRNEDQWQNIEATLPRANDVAGRIVVTTTIQSVANACSSGNGYVHKMSRLNQECSEQLFRRKACPEIYLSFQQPNPAPILKICDGQPLALVTMGKFLQIMGWPIRPRSCEDVCNNLHYHMKNSMTLESMRRVLIHKYTCLRPHALKACLLYFGMFPCDYPIRRKTLSRQWLAEGFVEPLCSASTPDPAIAFDALMDHNIIEPVNISHNGNVKTCHTYGMMQELMLHLSFSQNFDTLYCDGRTIPQFVRRLSLHQKTARDDHNLSTVDLSLVRSLTIFGEASEAMLDFTKYQLLRVLDLEKCETENWKDGHLKNICSLLLLKYLSLGKNVKELSKDVAKLTLLQTLDLRGSNITMLPEEVFQMPSLVHLFGKFNLPNEVKSKYAPHFISKGRSALQTIAGFIADGGGQGYVELIGRMKKLRKLKIWCQSTAGPSSINWTYLQEAIQQFVRDNGYPSSDDRSLSLHFDASFEDYLHSLKEPCYLSSLKLHGELRVLPRFVISLRDLNELCLSSIKLTRGLLESLTKLSHLKYLKLVAKDLENFTIKGKAFPNLLRLCFMLQSPMFLTIEEGSMPSLITLQLLCKDLDGLCGIQIENLQFLQEVILDCEVVSATREIWEHAARGHPNRPKIL